MEVFDRESTWRVGRSGGGRGGSNGGRGGSNGQRGEREPRTYDSLDLGEKGHDYERDGDVVLVISEPPTTTRAPPQIPVPMPYLGPKPYLGPISTSPHPHLCLHPTPARLMPQTELLEIDEATSGLINKLLASRLEAKMGRDFDKVRHRQDQSGPDSTGLLWTGQHWIALDWVD